MSRRPFDVLFLDFYGTVTSGDRLAVEQASTKVVEELRLPVTPGQFAIEWGKVFFAEADAANHDRFRNLFQIECESLVQTLLGMGHVGVDPRPYVAGLSAYWSNPTLHAEALETLESVDVPICCVSNADSADLRSAIARHGLQFSGVVTSEDARCYKPHRSIFEVALAKMGVEPGRVLHAGDSLHADVSGAAPLGITTAWVCREERIYDVGVAQPHHTVRCLRGLPELIR